MGNWLSQGKEQNPELVKQVRQARIDYQDYLTKLQTNTNADVNSKRLTPESGKAILAQVQSGFDWLKKNPNANFSEVLANYDSVQVEVKRILETDGPKRAFYNMIEGIPVIAKDLSERKRLTSTQVNELQKLADQELKWYEKNSVKATPVDFTQETIKINDAFITIIPEKDVREEYQGRLTALQSLSPGDLKDVLAKADADIEKRKAMNVDVREGVNIVFTTALKTVLTLFLVTLALLGGSIAANSAIGRIPAYRILYFIWGTILFPIVYLYAIYKRIREGPFAMYAVLPLTTEAATTRFGRFLQWPFYWVPDMNSVKAADDFQKALESVGI
jgi:hypothetical protein